MTKLKESEAVSLYTKDGKDGTDVNCGSWFIPELWVIANTESTSSLKEYADQYISKYTYQNPLVKHH